ncbi:MAG: SBBP repeat-containing protein [Blastocatellia bacterium]
MLNNSSEFGYDIAVDASGQVYVIGATNSFNFPTMNPLQASPGGGANAFVTKLNAAGTALIYSTYLGGGRTDVGQGIAVDSAGSAYDIAADPAGNAYVTGATGSTNFPLARPIQSAYGGGNTFRLKLTDLGIGITLFAFNVSTDAFVLALNPAGSALVYSTYLGGSGADFGGSIAVDSAGNAYVAGGSSSSNFPTTPGVFQTALGGGACGSQPCSDGFIAKLGADAPVTSVASVSAASFLGAELAPESIVAAFGTGLATQTVVATDTDPNTPGIQLPAELAGTTVEVKDNAGTTRRAPLFFVSPTQVNYLMPPMTAPGAGVVTIKSGDGKIAVGTIQAASVAPGLFTANASGQGVAAGGGGRGFARAR